MRRKLEGFTLVALLLMSTLTVALVLNLRLIRPVYAVVSDDDNYFEYGVEWINDYPWPTSDLSSRDDSAQGLKNKLESKCWDGFEYSDSSAWESDFDDNEGSYVDTKDIVLFSGHGSKAWDWTYWKDTQSAYFPGYHDDRHLLPGDVKSSWGDKDLEWLAFDACEVTKSRDEWAAAMKGIHLILGFKTVCYDGGTPIIKLGYWWADGMVSDGPADAAKKVKDAWVWGAIQCESGYGVISRVLGEEWNCGNDYLWGQGTGPVYDDAPVDSYYYYWDDPINCIPARVVPLQDPPDPMPTYTVVPRTVTPAYVIDIANKLGMTGPGRVGPELYNNNGIYYMTDGTKYLEVSQTEGILFGDSSRLWAPATVQPTLPTASQARTIAQNFLITQGFMPSDASWNTTVPNTQSRADKDTGVVYDTFNLDWQVLFARTVGGYSVVGPGARLRVFVGTGGDVIGFYDTWRQIIPGPTVPIIEEAEARSILFNYGPQVALGGFPNGYYDGMVVNSVTLGYYESGYNQTQTMLMPTYIYNVNFTVSGTTAFTNEVYIPAVSNQLPPIADIVAPANNSTYTKGDTVTLQANTTTVYGTAPFTYRWSSDVDGDLGTGSTLSVSNLNVPSKEWQATPHTITLTVTDAFGLNSSDYRSLWVYEPIPYVSFRLLAVQHYFAKDKDTDIAMRSAEQLIDELTRYKNWQNATWGGFNYTSYIHYLSAATPNATLAKYYVGPPTNSNVASEITNFLGALEPGENNTLSVRIFYYIGHSSKTWDGKHYMQLNTKNSHPSGPSTYEELYADQLNTLLNSTAALQSSNCTLVILDTCYSGGFISSLSRRGRVILTATNSTQLSRGWIDKGILSGGTYTLEPGYWGWFTGRPNANFRNGTNFGALGILGGLRTGNDNNNDGWRSAGEVFAKASSTTPTYAKNYPRADLPHNGEMSPKSDYWVLGGGIPLVMSSNYLGKWDGNVIALYETPFPYNAAPWKLIARPRDWPMWRYGSRQTGMSTASGPGTSLLWSANLVTSIIGSPIIADGMVVACNIHFLDLCSGATIKPLDVPLQIEVSGFVHLSGNFVFASTRENSTAQAEVLCIDEYTGVTKWSYNFPVGVEIRSSPTVANGKVFVTTMGGGAGGYWGIYVFNITTGEPIWDYRTTSPIRGSAAVADGRVFVATLGGGAGGGTPYATLYCLNETTGACIWSYNFATGTSITSSPAVAGGKVFIGVCGGGAGGGIYAFDEFAPGPTGIMLWDRALPGNVTSSPAVDIGNNRVIVGCMDGYTYALSATSGTPVWPAPALTGPINMSSPAISSNGYVYIGSTNGRIYCLNETNGAIVWDYNTGAEIVSSPALTDDHVVIGSTNGYLYCFGPPFPINDIAVTNVTISPTTINPGDTVNINYTVKNKGNHAETFNVICAYNYTTVWTAPTYNDTTPICTETVTLNPGAQVTRTCTWNTTGFEFKSSKYSISVQAYTSATPLEPEETYTQDNNFKGETLTILGVEVHDVAVLSVTPSNTTAYPTWINKLNITVVVKNEGTVAETFNVTAYCNTTAIGTQTVSNLAPDTSATLVFQWGLSGLPIGSYVIKAEADIISGELDIHDNTLTDGTVSVKFPGDANGSNFVDVSDFSILAGSWFKAAGQTGYDPRADFNGSGFVDVSDFTILAANWFKGP